MSDLQTIKTITVQANQTLADIAVQEYGTVEGMILIVQANPGLTVTTALEVGQELHIWTNVAINLVNESVKANPTSSELQSMLMRWIHLVVFPSQVNVDWNATSGVTEILNKPFYPCTQAEYDAIATKDPTKLYLIKEGV